jgi:D-lactate dehydrogenase
MEIAAARTGPQHRFRFVQDRLTMETAPFSAGCEAVCAFVNDDLGAAVLEVLHEHAIRHVALRSSGYNHVDLKAAAALGMSVVRVPAYSPNAVAEHTIALILAANRHIPRAYERVRNRNFSLEGLVGFNLAGKTVGVLAPARSGRSWPACCGTSAAGCWSSTRRSTKASSRSVSSTSRSTTSGHSATSSRSTRHCFHRPTTS